MCCFPLRQSQANRGPACAFWGMITAAQPGNWHHDRFRRAKKTALGTSGAASARQTQPHANLLLFYFFDFLGSGAGTRTKKRGALHRTVFPFLSLRSTGRLGQEGSSSAFRLDPGVDPLGGGPCLRMKVGLHIRAQTTSAVSCSRRSGFWVQLCGCPCQRSMTVPSGA